MTLTPTRQPERIETPEVTELLITEAREHSRRRRLIMGVAILAVVALAIAGLIFGRQTPVPRSSRLAGASSSTTGVRFCSPSALTTRLGRRGGAMGTSYQAFEMINHSTSACALSGVPLTQPGLLTGSAKTEVFKSIGPKATTITFSGFPKRGGTVVLRHGTLTSVTFGMETAADFAPGQCLARTVNAVRLVFQSGRKLSSLLYKIHPDTVCTKLASTQTDGVVLGTRFP